MKVRAWMSRNRDLVIIEAVAIIFAILALTLYLVTGMTPPMGPVRW